jgi:molecular chaperone GrpE (heat shock protein)
MPLLDSFEVAPAAAQTAANEKSASLQAGIVMVQSQLRNVLADAAQAPA